MSVKQNILKKSIKLKIKIKSIQGRSPFAILIAAAIIGALTGAIGSLFMICVDTISYYRTVLSQDLFPFENGFLTGLWYFVIAAIMGFIAYSLVKYIAPETGGSGIPEIEGAMLGKRPVRFLRVLPVKFIGGLGALGSGMVLGREGPTVQMGANIGQMISKIFGIKDQDFKHTFLAAGAGAGITAAFNAPLAGILFVTEEMRADFKVTTYSIKAVFMACIISCVTTRILTGNHPIFLNLQSFSFVPSDQLWLYFIFGILLGIFGAFSNFMILGMKTIFGFLYKRFKSSFVITGTILAGIFGILSYVKPEIANGGFAFIPEVINGIYPFYPLFLFLIIRFVTSTICFSSGAPGGIFSPTLALGTICGVLFAYLINALTSYDLSLQTCAVIGMAGLFTATIRAPMTGIVLILEITGAYHLILPLMATCLAATFTAQTLGAKPLYYAILQMTLNNEAKKTKATN